MTSFAGNVSIVGLWDHDTTNVLPILVHTQYSEATDARDRLFAFKGLLSREDTDIEVEYSEPAETVYRKWALRRIRRTQSLDFLTLCTDSGSDSKKKKMPSWVPDLRNVSLVKIHSLRLRIAFPRIRSDHTPPQERRNTER
jgi:hypothetical protein